MGLEGKEVIMTRLFYPAWWLKLSGYFDSKINSGPDVIMFAPNPYTNGVSSGVIWLLSLLFTALLSSALSLTISHILRNKKEVGGSIEVTSVPFSLSVKGPKRAGYVTIDV